eukprot:tig00020801_g13962.t1
MLGPAAPAADPLGLGVPAASVSRKDPRVQAYEDALRGPDASFERIRSLAMQGVPESSKAAGLRAKYWKILLKVLSPDPSKWAEETRKRREEYRRLCMEVLIDPSRISKEAAEDDHPLSDAKSSRWAAYFQDHDLIEQIRLDVTRTHTELNFFASDEATHQESLKRILYLYAKQHPKIKYVQGMNEVLAPLYYVLCVEEAEDEARHPTPQADGPRGVEADAYFCFSAVLADVGDRFSKAKRSAFASQLETAPRSLIVWGMDSAASGVRGLLAELAALLRAADYDLSAHLASLNVDFHFFGLRWVTLLLSQEFPLPDVLRIWDSVLADRSRFKFLLYVCCGMLICVRDRLLGGDFAVCVKTLQRYPADTDVAVILKVACAVRDRLEGRKGEAVLGGGPVPPNILQLPLFGGTPPASPAKPAVAEPFGGSAPSSSAPGASGSGSAPAATASSKAKVTLDFTGTGRGLERFE